MSDRGLKSLAHVPPVPRLAGAMGTDVAWRMDCRRVVRAAVRVQVQKPTQRDSTTRRQSAVCFQSLVLCAGESWHRALLVALVACAVLCVSGCKSDNHTTANPPTAQRTPAQSPVDDQSSTTLRLLAEELNSSRLAAKKVASMPPVKSPLARREILLHAAMYRAAYQTRVSHLERFVLEPVSENDPPDIGLDPEEFRLRVLSALNDLGVPIAWVTETWRNRAIDYFPGSADRATRLRITIAQRNDNTGIVTGEISDWTADLGASKQRITCRWDGLMWQIDRDPLRMVW